MEFTTRVIKPQTPWPIWFAYREGPNLLYPGNVDRKTGRIHINTWVSIERSSDQPVFGEFWFRDNKTVTCQLNQPMSNVPLESRSVNEWVGEQENGESVRVGAKE